MCVQGCGGEGDWGGGESGKKISVRCRDVFCHISRLTWTFLCLQAAERRGEERRGQEERREEDRSIGEESRERKRRCTRAESNGVGPLAPTGPPSVIGPPASQAR